MTHLVGSIQLSVGTILHEQPAEPQNADEQPLPIRREIIQLQLVEIVVLAAFFEDTIKAIKRR